MITDAYSKTIYDSLSQRASEIADKEPLLKPYLNYIILKNKDFESCLASLISMLIATSTVGKNAILEICSEAYADEYAIVEYAAIDLMAVCERDPAVNHDFCVPFLNFKGYHALQSYRVANWLYKKGRTEFALYIQSLVSRRFGVDIHPEARIGHGIMLDHGTAIVIGQTAVVENNVSIMQEVTLGGTGKESGDRHPKIAEGVLIGAGAKVLGNIKVGTGAKIGAGSVVLNDVMPHTTVAGIPARVVGRCSQDMPSFEMDQAIGADSLCTQACAINFIPKQ